VRRFDSSDHLLPLVAALGGGESVGGELLAQDVAPGDEVACVLEEFFCGFEVERVVGLCRSW